MPRTCTICRSDRRQEVDQKLLEGAAFRNIAAQGAFSAAAVFRHRQHVPAKLAKAHEARETIAADNLLEELLALSRETREILAEARQSGRPETALRALARAENQWELKARLLGELRDAQGATVNVNVAGSAEIHVLMTALAPFPEARAAASAALLGRNDA